MMFRQGAGMTSPRDARILFALAVVVGVTVFVIDALTPLDIAIAVLYVVVVLLVASTGSRQAAIATACTCVVLTLVAFMMSHDVNYSGGSIARCVVSLLAIGTTSFLALRNQANTARLQEQIQLLNLTHDAIVAYDMSDRITFWNQGAEELYGWTANQAIGQRIHELTRTSSSIPIDALRDEVVRKGRWEGELERVRSDGSSVIVSSRFALWRDDKGRPRAVLATNNDITVRKRMEAELLRQQEELRATIDAIPGMVWSSSRDGELSYINRRWNELGITLAGNSGEVWTSIVHPDDWSAMHAAWRGAIATGKPFENVARIRQSNGAYRWMHIGAEPLRDQDGRILRWYGVNTDIEERKQAEQALERSEAFLSDAQRLSRTGSIATRLPAGDMWWSDEVYRIFEYSPDYMPAMQLILARTHPDDLARVRDAYAAGLSGAPYVDVEHRLQMPDGRIKYVHYVAHLAVPQSANIEYVGALMDVTERQLAQDALDRSTAELAHVTRVTMLGELAASIAHEVTQPLAAIVTAGDAATRWLNRAKPDLGEVGQSISQMVRDAKRASDVIRQIRAMAQKRDPSQAVLDLNGIVRESIELVRRELDAARVELEASYAEPPLFVCGDRVQLQQVVINLVMNGVQAMAGVTGRARHMRIGTRRVDGHYGQVAVEDSGTGISGESVGRLFNAFFTTKADGMGMGLSICRSIVEAHGGRIWAESEEGRGATMQFVLPIDKGTCDEQ
ncbi:PAS domain S-box protein [Paraburkholderia sp. Tr-20389]|uniref:PAS domain-containing sensor histidine kinase n=1 Tax=Paraburkholderia sp. Tr-20389 TaxID=2703903 RepID=UPI001980A1B5|nr:PAS domain S-box protein [Paraburkholderia sp. Tr-20389]MBN3751957.1 PAS domain S-box protein [Paraburkholderia sp. Tr-20389]